MLQVQPIVDKTTRFDTKWKQSGFVGKRFQYFWVAIFSTNIRVVSIKPLFVKCMSHYFQERKENDIANTVINIFWKGKTKYCYQYLQILLLILATIFLESKENIVINTCQRATGVSRDPFLNIYHLLEEAGNNSKEKCLLYNCLN